MPLTRRLDSRAENGNVPSIWIPLDASFKIVHKLKTSAHFNLDASFLVKIHLENGVHIYVDSDF